MCWKAILKTRRGACGEPMTWTKNTTLPTTSPVTRMPAIAYHDGLFVGIWPDGGGGGYVYDNYICYTNDPEGAWSYYQTGGSHRFSLTYGEGYWVSGRSTSIAYTNDPTVNAWSFAAGPAPYGEVRHLAYGNGYWVLVNYYYGFTSYYSPSIFGPWTPTGEDIGRVEFVNGLFLCTRPAPYLMPIKYTANPSLGWTTVSPSPPSCAYPAGSYPGTTYGNGSWIVGGRNAEVDSAVSWCDDITAPVWDTHYFGLGSSSAVTYAACGYVKTYGLGNNSTYTSTNLNGPWTDRSALFSPVNSIYGNGVWVIQAASASSNEKISTARPGV